MAVPATPASFHLPHLDNETKERFDDRRSTFHRYPQYIFPSYANNLDDTLETPYAYSHHQAAFYWTREDALAALIWNFPAQPPCLNCVLAGEGFARRCNRLSRQRKSRGMKRCCQRCERTGNLEVCVEMMEIRSIPKFLPDGRNFRPRISKYGVDMFLWTDAEKALRREGKVIWRPINLDYADAVAKAKLMEDFEAGAAGDITKLSINLAMSPWEQHNDDQKARLECQRMMRRKVATWDRADCATDLTESLPIEKEQEMTLQLNEHCDDDEEKLKTQSPEELWSDIEEQCERWKGEVLEARLELYEKEVKNQGRATANKNDEQWNENVHIVLRSIRDFFDQKGLFLEQGRDEESACRESARLIPLETRKWIQELIPGMLFPTNSSRKEHK